MLQIIVNPLHPEDVHHPFSRDDIHPLLLLLITTKSRPGSVAGDVFVEAGLF